MMSRLSGTPSFSTKPRRLEQHWRQAGRWSGWSRMTNSCRKRRVILAPWREMRVGSSRAVRASTACIAGPRKASGLYILSQAMIFEGLHSSPSSRYTSFGTTSPQSDSKNSSMLASTSSASPPCPCTSSVVSSLLRRKRPRSFRQRSRQARTKALTKPRRSPRYSGGFIWSREVVTRLKRRWREDLTTTCWGSGAGRRRQARARATDLRAGWIWRKGSGAVIFLRDSSLSASMMVVKALMASCMMVWQQGLQSRRGKRLITSESRKNQKESRSHRLLSENSSASTLLPASSLRIDRTKITRYLMSLQSIDSPSASSITSSPKREKNSVNLHSSSTTASEFRSVPSTPSFAQLYSSPISFLLDIVKFSVIFIWQSVSVFTIFSTLTRVSVLSPSSLRATLASTASSVSNCWLVRPQTCLYPSISAAQLKPVESHFVLSVVLISTINFSKLRVRSSSKAGGCGALASRYLCFRLSYIILIIQQLTIQNQNFNLPPHFLPECRY